MATAEGKVSQEGDSKAGRGSIVTNKKHSPTVPEQEEQSRSSSSNKGELSDRQTSTAMRQVHSQSRKSEYSSGKGKVFCLKAAPKAKQRGPR